MAWRWLTRMRTALYLLGALALLTLVATLVPQEPNVATTVADWRSGVAGPGVFVSQLIDLVGGYDVYGSAVFLALLVLLFTSLTACLIPRFRAWWRITRRSRPPLSRHLGDQEHVARIETDRTPEEALATARGLLARRRWRLREPDDDPAGQVAAEKGQVSREGGSLLFHLSFYVLLVAIVLGQLLQFNGQVGVVEGNSWTETAVGYWSYQPGRWWGEEDHRGFGLTLDEFHVDWHRDPQFGGQPSTFLSDVTITHQDGTTTTDTVGGNDPLVVDGMKIHQLDWGYAPRVVVEVDGEVVHDAHLTLGQGDLGVWEGAVKAPAADPDVGLDVKMWPYAPDGEDGPILTGAPWAEAPLLFFTEYRGDLRLSASQNVNQLDLTDLEEAGAGGLRLGGEFELEDGVVVRFPELRRWVGFQVSQRPTVPLLLVGATLVLLGLVTALYAYRRRIWAVAQRDATTGRTVVTVAGRAFQRPYVFETEFEDLTKDLAKQLDPTMGRPPRRRSSARRAKGADGAAHQPSEAVHQ